MAVSEEERALAAARVYPHIISLHGSWDRQDLEEMSLEHVRPDTWKVVQIPRMSSGGKAHFAAYRKYFDNPIGRDEERAFIHFAGVAFASQVYLNGHLVGMHGPTAEPFSLELTSYLQKENELVLLVQDWTSGILPVDSDIEEDNASQATARIMEEFSPGHPLNRSIRYKTISPMRPNSRLLGIWDAYGWRLWVG